MGIQSKNTEIGGNTVISVFQCNLNTKTSLLSILNLVLIKKKGLNLKYQGTDSVRGIPTCLVYHEQSSFADISIKPNNYMTDKIKEEELAS